MVYSALLRLINIQRYGSLSRSPIIDCKWVGAGPKFSILTAWGNLWEPVGIHGDEVELMSVPQVLFFFGKLPCRCFPKTGAPL